MKNLILIGAGDWGFEVYSWLKDSLGYGSEFKFKGFLNSDPTVAENNLIFGATIIGNPEDYMPEADDVFACTIGSPAAKMKVTDLIEKRGGTFQTLIHKSVIVFDHTKLEDGVILSPYCVVSNNCTIGKHSGLNLMCTIGHDAVIGAYCQLNSHCDITGHVKIDNSVFMGSRVSVIPKVSVCANTVLGAGAVVIKDIKEEGTYVGNPARRVI
jgi:sugar O-acyltransferase (sialic acid O-acetyltransferase NeuD family)